MNALSALDGLEAAAAGEALARCCGSSRWIDAMIRARPFLTESGLHTAAARAFAGLERADWLEAFAHHPRIGDRAALEARFAATRSWSASEQAAVDHAGPDVLDALAAANRAYESRFGYVFLICATGKTPDEMLASAETRLHHDPEEELRVAAAEQRRITELRLSKLLEGGLA